METLDHVLGDREVLYAKIDAQGHDHAVLRGARRLLQSHRIRRVAFELSPALSAGSEARCVSIRDRDQRGAGSHLQMT